MSIDIMSPAARRPAQPARYTLYGVLYHHGVSAGGGHYTLHVLHPNRDGGTQAGSGKGTIGGGSGGEAWLHIDDENVSGAQHEDVFGHGNERPDDRCAYLLFYRRVGPART
jgi:ubiquitin carboxyl-terminal hydrolase 10